MRKETEILLDAETTAYHILSGTRLGAEEAVDLARDQAAALLLEEQKKAERLLESQLRIASESRRRTEDTAEGLPGEQGDTVLAREADEAEALLESQKQAAEVLLAAQEKAAAHLRESVQSQAADMVMEGQREAVAVLRKAAMQIQESRR